MNEIEQAMVYEDIIFAEAKETGKHVDIIINDVARYYNIDKKEIIKSLRLIDSDYADSANRIIGYIDGKPMKRTTYHMSCVRIFEKIIDGIKKSDVDGVFGTSQEHINFLTEATYRYLCQKSVPN